MARYQFRGACEFDPASGEVHRQGFVTRLEPQPAALLALLADRAGDIVSHEEIRRALRTSPRGIDFRKRVQSFIKQIRAALGDRAQAPRIIETIPRRGYRLKREAMSGGGGDSGRGGPQREGTLRTRSPKWLAIVCLALSCSPASSL